MKKYPVNLILALWIILFVAGKLPAQSDPRYYDIGTPALQPVWVDPVNGSDDNSGESRDQALHSVDTAWQRIPAGQALTGGVHILLAPGNYPAELLPNYWESRYGTFEHPVIIEAADGKGTAMLTSVNVFDSRYIYFINLTFNAGADAFHCEKCDHLLLRGNTFIGADPETYNAQETVKVNQSQYVYVEDNDVSGAWDNAVDFVAVQYGHFVGNRIHNAGDWCLYLKGGSAYFRVEGNEFYDCGTGGFTAGQGTGFQFMTPPWLQYEAYAIQFVNNLIHDTAGAGIGVQGGYNILMAYNRMYRVGERSHLIEVVFGSRSCDGQPGDEGRARCDEFRAMGGWGNSVVADGDNYVRIPNKHVYIYNNVIYNPPGYQSAYQHFAIFQPYSGASQAGSGVDTALADDDLQIRGNLIWNGPPEHPMGIEYDAGCAPQNLTCNLAQIQADNLINTADPLNTAPLNRTIADFTWDVPVPPGEVSNAVGTPLTQADVVPLVNLAASAVIVPTVIPSEAAPEAATPAPATAVMAAVEPLPPGPVVIVTLGDSLTEGERDDRDQGGYPGRLRPMIEALRPGSTLLNVGHSGWNSDALINGDQGLPGQLGQAVEAISAARTAGQPALALVWIGSNDLFYLYEYNDPDAAAEQADLENYTRNLDTILSQLTGAGAQVVMALLDDQSLRPVVQRGEAFPGIRPAEINQMSEQVRRYNAAIAGKAAQYGALTVDFFNTTIFTDAATLADDGNHPNASGYDVIAERWLAVIRALL